MGMLFSALVYLAFSYMSAKVFGMENLRANLLENMDNGNMFFVSVKLLFLLIFACAIPFNVIVPKRCILNIIEESAYATVSTNLNQNRTVDVEQIVTERTNFWVSIGLQATLCLASCIIKDLTTLFAIIATFSENVTNCILPGLFLICSVLSRRNSKNDDEYS